MNLTPPPNINYLWTGLMVEELVRNGVDTFCISSGSRSSPLTMAVAAHSKAKSLIHFDERGNAFRALGIAGATKKPCVVITTSGTAAANLFPAVIEASKKKIPLVVLTADRPPELRWTGAHQTIDQTKIYGEYVRWYFDLPCPTADIPPEFVLTTIDQAVFRSGGDLKGPVHINCMYREPLAPVKTRFNFSTYTQSIKTWQKNLGVYTEYIPPKPSLAPQDMNTALEKVRRIKSGIIVVGKLSTPQERSSVLKLAEQLNWPVFPDIASGLRLGNIHPNIIHYFDQILLSDTFKRQYRPDGIVHFGGRITSKRWYEYIAAVRPKHYVMAVNHPLRSDPFHHVTTRVQCPVEILANALAKQLPKRTRTKLLSQLKKLNVRTDQAIEHHLGRHVELSEPQTARLITQAITPSHALFLSSSMPIREIDTYGIPNKNPVICGSNRGASGIDGTIATAVGFAAGLRKPVTLLIGDLAFLHDLNSLAMLRESRHPLVIVVQNNNGGGIFSFLPIRAMGKDFERFFGTPHHLTFSAAATLFNLNYARAQTADVFLKTYRIAQESRTSTLIEIQTDRNYNLKIHRELENAIKTVIDKNGKIMNGAPAWPKRLQEAIQKKPNGHRVVNIPTSNTKKTAV